MGVAGSTQRLRPLVNPDGSIGIKVRTRLPWNAFPIAFLIRTLPPMDPTSFAHLRPPGSFPPQINKRLIQKLDGIEDDAGAAPSVRYDPFTHSASSQSRSSRAHVSPSLHPSQWIVVVVAPAPGTPTRASQPRVLPRRRAHRGGIAIPPRARQRARQVDPHRPAVTQERSGRARSRARVRVAVARRLVRNAGPGDAVRRGT